LYFNWIREDALKELLRFEQTDLAVISDILWYMKDKYIHGRLPINYEWNPSVFNIKLSWVRKKSELVAYSNKLVQDDPQPVGTLVIVVQPSKSSKRLKNFRSFQTVSLMYSIFTI
jgi:hypothetical protein